MDIKLKTLILETLWKIFYLMINLVYMRVILMRRICGLLIFTG